MNLSDKFSSQINSLTIDADTLNGKNSTELDYVVPDDYEPIDVLNKIKIVDGSGSGLDADKIDGVEKNLLGVGGDGYAWVDETTNRSKGTTYTNTYGKPIQVAICFASSSSSKDWEFIIDDTSYVYTNYGSGVFNFIIPNNSTYSVDNADYDIKYWLELK